MFVLIELRLEPLKDQLTVLADAVRMTKRGPVVVRAAPGEEGKLQAEWIPVRVLGGDSLGKAILSLGPTLATGDRVVLTGVDLAFPGVPLLPREVQPGPAEKETGEGEH